jgi:RNA polymerase sigma-70 factor (ECF subfamily)
VAPVEKEIVELFAAGDVRSMDLLYDHYADTLYGIVLGMVKEEARAQDVLQDAFVKIWQYSREYDATKGRLFTWLLRITRNKAIDAIRKNKRSGEIYGKSTDVNMQIAEADNPDLSVSHDITKVLAQLSEHHKDLIEHSFILGYTHPEIAEKFEIPLGTVKTRIRSAMNELRTIFGNGHS